MADRPPQGEIDRWERWFGVECNNRAWDLIAREVRTPDEDLEMLHAAHAAAYHWLKVGRPVNFARADLTLAHAHALLGRGELALAYALRCLALFEAGEGEDWDLAFAHAEVAFAAAVLGDADRHARHYAAARQHGEAIAGEADRRIFMEELARIPAVVRGYQPASRL